MEREIKFKAKRLDNSEWMVGDLLHYHGDVLIFTEEREVKVDPSTVCQYTGLTDFFGNQLYEHDIVQNYPFKPVEIVWEEGGYYLRLFDGMFDSHTLGYHLSSGRYKFLRSKFDKEGSL